ncbi:MAG: RsmD family RNA methyltransferase [Aeoliella sp.]
MSKRKSAADAPPAKGNERDLRIIGGKFRASKLTQLYLEKGDDPVTRPMKHRVREAIFNLVSMEAKGRHAIDLFAGTGALGLEAISRGAASATFIERHIPTARVVRENIATIGVGEQCELLEASAFVWAKRDLPTSTCAIPWLVFVSPPYAFYVERQDDMLVLIAALMEHAPAESTLVVEADERFDFGLLPGGVKEERGDEGWDVRTYPPAVVGVWRKPLAV